MIKKNPMNRAYWNSLAADFSGQVLEISESDMDGVIATAAKRLGARTKSATDFGCGAGALTRAIAPYFKTVTGIDFSEKLIAEARNRTIAKNVAFETGDLLTMKAAKHRCDVGFCANVLLHEDANLRDKIAKSVIASISARGRAVFIVPALESALRAYQVTLHCQTEDGFAPARAAGAIDRQADGEIISLSRGIIKIGAEPTKHYLQDELTEFLGQHGLHDIVIMRVNYPWTEVLENAPRSLKAAPPWDWLAVGRKG